MFWNDEFEKANAKSQMVVAEYARAEWALVDMGVHGAVWCGLWSKISLNQIRILCAIRFRLFMKSETN